MEYFSKKMTKVIWYIAFFFSSLLSQTAQDELAVMPLAAGSLTQDEALTLTDRLITEIINLGRFTVVERSRMDEILKEQGFQQSGCTNSDCALEMGQLLGVKKLIFGNIGKIGSVFSLSIRLIDVSTGKIIKTASVDIKGSIEDVLLKGIAQSVKALFKEEEVKKEVRKPAASKNSHTVINVLAAVAGAGGLGCGGIAVKFWMDKKDFHDKYLAAYEQQEMDSYIDKEETALAQATVFTAVSAVMIPASAVMFLINNHTKKQVQVSLHSQLDPEVQRVWVSCNF